MPVVDRWSWFRHLIKILSPETPLGGDVIGAVKINSLAECRPNPDAATIPRWYDQELHFWRWMEQAGFAMEYDRNEQNPRWAIADLGIRRLDSEHPLRPGTVERLWAQFGDDHEDSLARLEDAITCLEAGLYRAAVVLLGLSYEELVKLLHERLDPKAKAYNALDRQKQVRKRVENAPNSEPKERALAALNVADSIREERNDAAHKAASEWEATEVDELLADGLRSYAKLASYSL